MPSAFHTGANGQRELDWTATTAQAAELVAVFHCTSWLTRSDHQLCSGMRISTDYVVLLIERFRFKYSSYCIPFHRDLFVEKGPHKIGMFTGDAA